MSELNEKLATAWEGFTKGDWQNEVNVRDFIQKNYTPYEGDESSWLALLKRPPPCGTK
ncbi:Pyruvate formate-lyase [Escherichia coli]|nr:Pyruvate formate-lyase [Escherichia coli]